MPSGWSNPEVLCALRGMNKTWDEGRKQGRGEGGKRKKRHHGEGRGNRKKRKNRRKGRKRIRSGTGGTGWRESARE